MKRILALMLVICGTFVLGIAVGRYWQQVTAGSYYEVRTEQEIPYPVAPVFLRYVTKSVGLPFLDPGTTILTLDDQRFGPITLYEARRGFQESTPFVADVSVRGNNLDWEDGVNRYSLHVEPLRSSIDTDSEDDPSKPERGSESQIPNPKS